MAGSGSKRQGKSGDGLEDAPDTAGSGKLQPRSIIIAALEVMNTAGLEALTMRRLADRLGVQAPALYWHFRNKKALLDAMLDALLSENLDAPRDGETADVWLNRIGHRLRESLLTYRDAARLVTQVQLTPRMIEERLPRFNEGFRRMGIRGEDALYSSISIVAFIVGWVQTEQNMRMIASSPASDDGTQWLAMEGDVLRMPAFGVLDMNDAFDTGLLLLIDGCRALASRQESKQASRS